MRINSPKNENLGESFSSQFNSDKKINLKPSSFQIILKSLQNQFFYK
jgi:hypothetical protein